MKIRRNRKKIVYLNKPWRPIVRFAEIDVRLGHKIKGMEGDKNLYTEKVPAGKRTYFLDVMENHKGHKYIKFTESRANEGEFIRQSLRIFQEDFDKIFEALDKVQGFIKSSSESESNDLNKTEV